MAIISCKKCGKRYSNTVSACIECGNPTPSFITVNDIAQDNAKDTSANVERDNISAETKGVEEDEEAYVDYYTLPPEYIMELDDEFILQNEWALKLEQKKRGVNVFQAAFIIMSICSVWLFIFMMFATNLIRNNAIADKAVIGIMIAFLVGVMGTIVCGFIAKRINSERINVLWNDMRNEWLKKEKYIIVREKRRKS